MRSRLHPAMLGGKRPMGLKAALRRMGLVDSAKVILDASDPASYTSGQKWLDVGTLGTDFFLGLDVSAQASDPTFTGPPGVVGSYFSLDGGDLFQYDTTNETWMEDCHKDNALHTWIAIVQVPSLATTPAICGTTNAVGTSIGAELLISGTTGILSYRVGNGTSKQVFGASTAALAINVWGFVVVSINEAGGAGASYFRVNDFTETFNGQITSPSASSASNAFQLGARGSAAILPAGSKYMGFAAFATNLSASQTGAIFSLVRSGLGV